MPGICIGIIGGAGIGLGYVTLILAGSIWMVNPPEGYKPVGWEPPAPSATKAATGQVNLTSSEMLRTPQYYMLLLM